MTSNIQTDVTNRVIAAMTTAGTDWTAPFRRSTGGAARSIDGHVYQGINALLLGLQGGGIWATYNAWKKRGAQVSKGQRGTGIVFFKTITKEDSQTGETESFGLARGYTVFSADQVEGWDGATQITPDLIKTAEVAERFITETGAVIRYQNGRAFYSPKGDFISVPADWRNTPGVDASAGRYLTTFHELGHWTGAVHRLDRKFGARFGDQAYAFEELVAELTSAFLAAALGVTGEADAGHVESHAKYLNSWIARLKEDKRAIFTAAAAAQKAVAYLSNAEQVAIAA
jgi:antirestriction protein ArdC